MAQRLRADGPKRFPPEQTIRSIKLYRRQVYGYAYHRPKSSRPAHSTTNGGPIGVLHHLLISWRAFQTTCPHALFRRDDDPAARASQAHPPFADVSRIIVNSKHNAATDTAALIIPAVGNNKLRHETLQRFMLPNDSVTVAIEVPIWLTKTEIAALEQEHRMEIAW
jgi:hypothetical protein